MAKNSKRDRLLDAILGNSVLTSTRTLRANSGKASLYKFSIEDKNRSELEQELEVLHSQHQKEIEELRAKQRNLENARRNNARLFKDPRIVVILILKRKYPHISQRELCAKLDVRTEKNAARGPLPVWEKKTWVEAYDDPKTRPKLKVFISKVKLL